MPRSGVTANATRIQYLLCVCVIHLPQYFVREPETVQAPVVSEHFRFVEMLIPCFENSEGDTVHLLVESHVSTIEQTVRMLFIKLCGPAGDGCGFCIARGDIGRLGCFSSSSPNRAKS